MQYRPYPTIASGDMQRFDFESKGSKGVYSLLIEYNPMLIPGFYNLGFGTLDTDGNLDFKAVLNNGDTKEILATVALTALEFTDRYPGNWIFFVGATPSRTRLYQMGIANNFEAISENFTILGSIGNNWSFFERGVNYTSFMAKRNL